MSAPQKAKFIAFCFLLLAIAFEILGTSFLKLESSLGVAFVLVLMSGFIAVSYYFMGLSLRQIQVGVAYALWELLGALGILAIAFFVFEESLSASQLAGVGLALLGIILINLGEVKQP